MCSTTGVESPEPSRLPDGELRELLLATWRDSCRIQARLTRLVAAFDARQAGEADAARTTAAWLRAFCRLTGPQASALVAAARTVAALPGLAEAFADGQVGSAHVDRVAELARRVGVDRVAAVEPTLVAVAQVTDAAELAVVCQRVRAHVDPDGVAPHVDFERRGLSLAAFDGMVAVKGQLDAEGGATVATALDALTTPAGEHDDRSPAQRRADALVELARLAISGGTLPSVAGQRPHLGVLVSAETLATATDTAPRLVFHGAATPGSGAPAARAEQTTQTRTTLAQMSPAQTTTVAQPATLAEQTTLAEQMTLAEPGWTPWAGALHGPTLRRLACDSIVWRVVLDPTNGLPLDLGRQHRTVPGWLRRALIARDHGCRFPGCAAPADWCDGHHLRSWLNGGQTTITNLILLCRYHHVRIHEHGWSIHLDRATGDVTATRPNGRPYEIRRSPPHTATWQHHAWLNVDHDIGHRNDAA